MDTSIQICPICKKKTEPVSFTYFRGSGNRCDKCGTVLSMSDSGFLKRREDEQKSGNNPQ
jgi:hypothetical protein